ncbi:MAG: hypothetical protein JF597_53905 [Streptomyces sp.]|uniref:hypothetical protein n=1 Tax=Streptomyces sp. TaxID=1931 RepID=UPI0025EC9C39|nr:hypothetical protein [Streptomyces sp.]MBW8802106.1 hypothetical protein [Streptomyces sp.]
MGRIFTKRIACGACRNVFTITSAASKFCKSSSCISARRKADRLAAKQRQQRLASTSRAVQVGSDQHLARALASGE